MKRSMDFLCDNILEEILRRLPAKYLHRVRAVSRRYNDLVLSPGFVARYWKSHSPYLSGVFLQTESMIRPWGHFPDFLAGSPRTSATESIFASDLGFLPHQLPDSQLQFAVTEDAKRIFIVHSTAGLLLCSRGRVNVVQYYVCNPVSWQWVSLPGLPLQWLRYSVHGLLSVTDNGDGNIRRFQVFLLNHPVHWSKTGGCLELKVFSSDTGQWSATAIRSPPLDVYAYPPVFLGQSGTAYCVGGGFEKKVIAYNCNLYSIETLPLPDSVPDSPQSWCIGERKSGRLRYAHIDSFVLEVWDLRRKGKPGMCWTLVHQVDVRRNMEAASRAAIFAGSTIEGRIYSDSHFCVLNFHPTKDIIYMDVANTVAAYSMKHGSVRYESPRRCNRMDTFSYVHPAHPVHIPMIKRAPLE